LIRKTTTTAATENDYIRAIHNECWVHICADCLLNH